MESQNQVQQQGEQQEEEKKLQETQTQSSSQNNKIIKWGNCNNNIKLIFGENITKFTTQISGYVDLSKKKSQKNTKKYQEALKLKNEKSLFVIKFRPNPKNSEESNKKNFADFQKYIKNLIITLKALNKQAKEYIKNFTLSFAIIKNEFCIGVQLSKEWEETIFALYEGIQLAANIELTDLQKRLIGSVNIEKGVKQIANKNEKTTMNDILSLLENFSIEAKMSITVNELLDILKLLPFDFEAFEDKFYHILYILRKMKNSDLQMQFENPNGDDIEEIFNIPKNQHSNTINQQQLPWKINILPKLVDLFHSAFVSQIEFSININRAAGKAFAHTDDIFELINKLIQIQR